jgi:predicted amidohydrolase
VVNRCRALENIAAVVAANQGASARHYPPFSWPGGSMVVDHDGRVLSQADPGPGEKIVVGPVDIAAIRAERDRRSGHHMLAHRRVEAYRHAGHPAYPAGAAAEGAITIEGNEDRTRRAKGAL